MVKNIIFIIVFILFSSIVSIPKSNSQLSSNISVIDDSFINDAIENDKEIRNIENTCKHLNKKCEIIKNKYTDKFDTLIIFFNSIDTIRIYKSENKKIILYFSITSDKFKILNNTIKIGMNKIFLEKRYPNFKNKDILDISDTEGYSSFYFLFYKSKLKKIKYKSNYMD